MDFTFIFTLQSLQASIRMAGHDSHAPTTFMMVLLLMYSGDCLVYRILPSPSDPCPTQPCLTLSQFASDTSSYLKSNTTLIFQPGNHNLGSKLAVGGVVSLQLLKSTLPLGVRIICVQSLSLDLYNITSVHISRLEFIGCSSKGESIGQLSIKDTSFLGQENSSTALELVRSTAVIEGSSFTSNMLGNWKKILVRNLRKNSRQIVRAGGAIALTQSDIILMDVSVKENSAEVGGAMFGERNSRIMIINSRFERNHATSQSNDTDCYGGALYCQGGCTLVIHNSTFSNNAAVREQVLQVLDKNIEANAGGAIAIVGRAKADISESKFSSNEAGGDGGAIHTLKSTVNIDKCEFNNNMADRYGGAIHAQGSTISVMNITVSEFSNNKADNNGGAVYASNKYSVNINRSRFVNNTAEYGGAIQTRKGTLNISLGIFSNNKADKEGGAIYDTESTVNINQSEFGNNTAMMDGGAVYGRRNTITIIDNNFSGCIADIRGGAIHTRDSTINISKSSFDRNKAGDGGGTIFLWGGTVNINGSEFSDNKVDNGGGVIYVLEGTVNINGSDFSHNIAKNNGGVIRTFESTVNINWSEFNTNRVGNDGGVVDIDNMYITEVVKVHISGSVFCNNKGGNGGVIYAKRVTMTINSVDFIENRAGTGVLYISQSNILFSGNTTVANNIGSLFLFSSKLNTTRTGNIRIVNNSSPNRPNRTISHQQGGAITSFQSRVFLYGTGILVNNKAENGGAILATESKWFVYSELLVANNTATDSGGGAYLYQSEFNCKDDSTFRLLDNTAIEKGGGIHATSSLIKVDAPGSSVLLIANYANMGGGVCLEMNAKLYILKLIGGIYDTQYYTLLLSANSAYYGGAVYVTDETNSGTCDSTSYGIHSTLTECFIQTLALHDRLGLYLDNINFLENHAHISGPILFGGLLDRCTVSPFAEVYNNNMPTIVNGVTYFQTISTLDESSTLLISSYPVRVCFCRDGQPDFNSQSFHIKVRKGEVFTVPLIAVDQVNHTVNATIHVSLSSNLGGLGEDQSLQYSTKSCSDVKLSVFSPFDTEQVILYAKGPCKDAELSVSQINITFLPCTCPVGFQPNYMQVTKCTCDCDSKLSPFITECHQENKTIVREGNFWVSYLNITDTSSDYEYLIHPQCPLDYCHPPTTKVYIDLNTENGSDEQCIFNRSGILCGKCRSGFSLSIGSSHCIQCSVHWPVVCFVIIIAAFLAGIALVALLLALNITVATGTINGIVLYANIVNANSSTFFPFTEPNYITVFVAWLNLELGVDTCFFEGMDMYWKTLLQLAFPMYVIFLVVMVILISERSTKFARLIGRNCLLYTSPSPRDATLSRMPSSA